MNAKSPLLPVRSGLLAFRNQAFSNCGRLFYHPHFYAPVALVGGGIERAGVAHGDASIN